MTVFFTDLLDWCESAINDELNSVWARDKVIQWANEAMRQFPILRPANNLHQVVVPGHSFSLATDFREIVLVEFPINQDPPVYLTRKSRLDDDFYRSEDYYDLEYNFTGMGWRLWTSAVLGMADAVQYTYMASHTWGLQDNGVDTITIPDEYVHIIIAYVLMKGYKERLSTYMQDPTAYSGIISQMVTSVSGAEAYYFTLVKEAQDRLAVSKPLPSKPLDKFDRVY